MASLRFDWHPAKAAANLRKHAVSFDEAETVFSDDNALLVEDPDHSDDEGRFSCSVSAPRSAFSSSSTRTVPRAR